MDVLGRPIDDARPDQVRQAPLDPPARAEVRRTVALGRTARHRHQGYRPDLPVRQGRQDRPVRRRRRRQDREHAGADQQHREALRRLLGVRRRRRAHPRGQRLLPRDDRSEVVKPTTSESKVAMVFGQMNEPPGNRLRVALTGLTMAEELPRRRPRHPVLRRQHLPLHAGRHRSVRAARPDAVGGGLPADAGRRNGPPAGAHHLDQDRLDHLDPGRVRAGGRPDRPVARDHLRPPRRDRRALARHRLAGHLPGGRSARFHLAPGRPARHRRRPLQHHARGAGDAAALQGTARHHRDPGHGRTLAGRQARRLPRAQDPALPVAAVQRGRDVHRLAGQVSSRSRTPSRASR